MNYTGNIPTIDEIDAFKKATEFLNRIGYSALKIDFLGTVTLMDGSGAKEVFTPIRLDQIRIEYDKAHKTNQRSETCGCWDSENGKFHIICEKHAKEPTRI
jgi:hypothetical protein